MKEFIKAVGAGHRRARSLTRDEARQAMASLMTSATPEQVGAFLLAMRMKGETAEELAGFVDAVDAAEKARLETAEGQATAVPVDLAIDAHGDGRLGRPSMLVVAAVLLARSGLGVRLCTRRHDDIHHHLATTYEALVVQQEIPSLSMVILETTHPALERLIALRSAIGVRTFAHTVAKICLGPAKRMAVGVFHRPYREITAHTLALVGRAGLVVQAPGGLPEVAAERPCPAVPSDAHGSEPLSLDGRPLLAEEDRGALPEITKTEAAVALSQSVLAGQPGPARGQALICAAGLFLAAGRATNLGQGYDLARAALDARPH